MRCDRRLRGPVEHRLLLVIAQTCRVVECRVVSRRHRTVTNRLHDTFQLGRFLSASYVCQSETLRAWRGRVGRQISGRNCRVRGHGSSGGMAAVIRDSDRSFLLVPKTRNFDPFGQICRSARMQQPPGEPNRWLPVPIVAPHLPTEIFVANRASAIGEGGRPQNRSGTDLR